MSILIKGMEMPKSCCECPIALYFCNIGYEYLLKHEELYDERAKDCPLISIPPHGRLIDADALEVHDGWMNEDREKNVQQTYITFVYSNDIDNASTIIEAEGEE